MSQGGMAQLVGCSTMHQEVTGLVPGQGTGLGVRLNPQ